MKKIILPFIVILILLSVFSGCSKLSNADKNAHNDIILYNRYDQKLIRYDLDLKKAVPIYDKINMFEYEFPTQCDLYTVGHSINNHFKLLQILEGNQNVLLKLNSNEAIFPLATDNKKFYFIHAYYDENVEITSKRCIAFFDLETKQLHDIKSTCGFISKGTILHDSLYYTQYNEESDNYSIFKIDIISVTNNKPQLIDENLEFGDIYNDGSQIWIKNKDYLVSSTGDYKLKSAFLNYFVNKYIVQIDTNETGDLYLQIIDRSTSEIKYKKDKIYDFKEQDSKIIIYGEGFIEEFYYD